MTAAEAPTRTAPARGVAALLSVVALSGCVSMSGLGGESKYACKAPEGVACDSVSGTYANALAGNLPSQRSPQAGADAAKPPGSPEAIRPPSSLRLGLPAAGGSSVESAGSPLRSNPRYLRLWIKPWEDIDGDLYDQANVYVQIDQGRWLIDHVQRRIRDSYTPLRAPTSSPTASAPADSGSASPARAAQQSVEAAFAQRPRSQPSLDEGSR